MKINLLRNLPLKLISLLIAIFLWFMVTGKDYRYGDFIIPIELGGVPENMILTRAVSEGQEIKNATVRVRATETVLRSLDERSMYLQLDVSDLGVGHHLVQLNGEMVMGKPPGAEITEIAPRVLELNIEDLLIKPVVVVNPEILGKPADNFDIWQIKCDPPSVRVQGPKSVVEKIEKISTPQINVDGMTQSTIERSLLLVPPDPLVSIFPEVVSLRIRIGEKFISKNFRNIPVEIVGAEYLLRINPKSLSVTVAGPISQIENLSRENVRAFIRLTGDEQQQEDIRIDPQFACTPADSFPEVRLERFSQSYVDVFITDNRINQ